MKQVDYINSRSECNDLISIIVPVFNVEEYLERCVKCLQMQSYNNLEIILIDDGSTDSSGDICDKLAQEDARIRVIHQPNGGLSCARNTGLNLFTGEYVCFIDSDDYIHTDFIKYLYCLCKTNSCKISICTSIMTDKNDYEGVLQWDLPVDLYDNNEILHYYYSDRHSMIAVAWNKLLHKSVIRGIRFEPGIIHEDEATTFKYLYNAGPVVFSTNQIYYYFSRPDSITGSKFSEKNLDIFVGYKNRLDFYKDNKEKELYNVEYKHYMSALLIYYYRLYKCFRAKKYLRSNLHKDFKKLYKDMDSGIISPGKKLLFGICCFCPLLYGALRNIAVKH